MRDSTCRCPKGRGAPWECICAPELVCGHWQAGRRVMEDRPPGDRGRMSSPSVRVSTKCLPVGVGGQDLYLLHVGFPEPLWARQRGSR